eukprot:m.198635 g.198635  ORF g.198635 m.198635 type:complete len:541 (-) comp15485_c1_seq2:37-1659(-)
MSSLSMSSMSDESALPQGWLCYQGDNGRPYFVYEPTGEATWDDPRQLAHQALYAPRLDGISESSGIGTTGWAAEGSSGSLANGAPAQAGAAVETEFGFPGDPMFLDATSNPHAHLHHAQQAHSTTTALPTSHTSPAHTSMPVSTSVARGLAAARPAPPTLSFSGVQYAGPLPAARVPPQPQTGHLGVHTQHHGTAVAPHSALPLDPTQAILNAASRPFAPRSSRLSVARVARSPATTPLAESPSGLHMPMPAGSASTPTGSPSNSNPASPQTHRYHTRPPPLHPLAPLSSSLSSPAVLSGYGPDTNHHPLQRSFVASQPGLPPGPVTLNGHGNGSALLGMHALPSQQQQQMLFGDATRGFKDGLDLAEFASQFAPDSGVAMLDGSLLPLPDDLATLEQDPDGRFGFSSMATDEPVAGSLPLTSTAFFLPSGPASPTTAVPFAAPGPAGMPQSSFARVYSAPGSSGGGGGDMSVDDACAPPALNLPSFDPPQSIDRTLPAGPLLTLANTPISPNSLNAMLDPSLGAGLLSPKQVEEMFGWC